MTSTPTDAVQRQSLRNDARRQLRRAAKWACAAGLLIAQTVALADEGTETSTIRIIAVQPSAEASEAGVAPDTTKPEGEPSGVVPAGEEPAKGTERSDFKVVPAEPLPGHPTPVSHRLGRNLRACRRSSPRPARNQRRSRRPDDAPAVNDIPYEIQPIGRLGADISTPREILERGEHPDKNYDYAAKVFANRPTIDARDDRLAAAVLHVLRARGGGLFSSGVLCPDERGAVRTVAPVSAGLVRSPVLRHGDGLARPVDDPASVEPHLPRSRVPARRHRCHRRILPADRGLPGRIVKRRPRCRKALRNWDKGMGTRE